MNAPWQKQGATGAARAPKPSGDFNYKRTDNPPAWTFVRTTVWFPLPEDSKLVPGCGSCARFAGCQQTKRVRADTEYCQWSKNRFSWAGQVPA